jgi:hypothetical protein
MVKSKFPRGLFEPETFVVAELTKWIRTSGSSLRLFYYRTRSGLEADLLIDAGGKLAGAEIKACGEVDAGDAGRLCRIAEAAGNRWLGGMVIYSGTTLRPLREPDIWAVPASRLLSGF